MNTKPKILVFAAYTLFVVLVGLGNFVAFTILQNNKVITDGILGLVVLSLTYYLFILPKKKRRDDRKLGEVF